MNWKEFIERLDHREKQTTEQYINEEDANKRESLRLKILLYREEKREIDNLIKKETVNAMAQRQAKEA